MKKLLIGLFPFVLVILAIGYFFLPFILKFKLPIPADTIIGLYHPFRDLYSQNYPNGIPYKNFLITDPIRQTYLWKELVMNLWTSGNIPLWNPYEMAGKPLLGNFQSGVFYPLNIILLLKPFYLSWSIFVLLQSVLSGFFMYIYLIGLKLGKKSATIGSLVFCFSGFSVSWLEWGTIGHTALWLPLVLLSIDKIFKLDIVTKIEFRKNKQILWIITLIVALLCSFFAGHLQTFFYLYLVTLAYFILRWVQNKRSLPILFIFIISNLIFLVAAIPQLFSTFQFINLSSRNLDQDFRTIEGWFMPWQHLIQFVSPDFFGNPATLNYWGTWNYGELVGYIGILPLIFVIFSLFKRSAVSLFYTGVLFIGLLFILPTGISSLPFILHIPFISTAQPTRLLFLVTFALSVLSSIGFEYLIHQKKFLIKNVIPVLTIGLFFAFLWVSVFAKFTFLFPKLQDLAVAKRNLVFPSILFLSSVVFFGVYFSVKKEKIRNVIFIFGVLIIAFDLLRFAQKFTPFVSLDYLYPETPILKYLMNQKGTFRIVSLDRRIMPPNFYTHYKLQTIEGYDPLYLQYYAEYITVLERNKPDIRPPFGFNRIITPHNYNSQLFDLLNVRYVLSFEQLPATKFALVMEEGKTKLYINKDSFERTFFVKNTTSSDNIADLFATNLHETAIVSDIQNGTANLSIGHAQISNYSENEVIISTINSGAGFLVLSDVYYPTWKAYIDGKETKIYKTDHSFRGVFVPSGNHTIIFKASLF